MVSPQGDCSAADLAPDDHLQRSADLEEMNGELEDQEAEGLEEGPSTHHLYMSPSRSMSRLSKMESMRVSVVGTRERTHSVAHLSFKGTASFSVEGLPCVINKHELPLLSPEDDPKHIKHGWIPAHDPGGGLSRTGGLYQLL